MTLKSLSQHARERVPIKKFVDGREFVSGADVAMCDNWLGLQHGLKRAGFTYDETLCCWTRGHHEERDG